MNQTSIEKIKKIDSDIQRYEEKISQLREKISALQKKRTEIENSQILTAIGKLNMPVDEVIEYISLIKDEKNQEVNSL